MDQILVFQTAVLRICGFMELNTSSCGHRWYPVFRAIKLVGIFLVIAVWLSFTLGFCGFLSVMLASCNSTKLAVSKNTILESISFIPYVITLFRNAVVISVLLHKRSTWEQLFAESSSLINVCVPETEFHAIAHYCKRRAAVHTVTTVIFGLLPNVLYWYSLIGDIQGLDVLDDYYPLPIKLTYWEEIVWETCVDVPAVVICAMAYSSMVIMAKILSECAKAFNQEIVCETNRIRAAKGLPFNEKSLFNQEVMNNVIIMTTRYLHLTDFCETLNKFFGKLLFTMWGLDVLAGLAFVAGVVSNPYPNDTSNKVTYMKSTNALIYFSFATALLVPLAFVHKQGENIIVSFHRLSATSTTLCRTVQDAALGQSLMRLLSAGAGLKLVIDGAGHIQVTHRFLSTVFTLALSFAVVANEVFGK